MSSVSCVLPLWCSLLDECCYAFLSIVQPEIVNHHFTCFPKMFPQSHVSRIMHLLHPLMLSTWSYILLFYNPLPGSLIYHNFRIKNQIFAKLVRHHKIGNKQNADKSGPCDGESSAVNCNQDLQMIGQFFNFEIVIKCAMQIYTRKLSSSVIHHS